MMADYTVTRKTVKNCLTNIKSGSWKRLTLHADEASARQNVPPSTFEYIDIINDSHAFCLVCRFHIYTQSSGNDLASFHIGHLNAESHAARSLTTKQKTILEPIEDDRTQCLVCDVVLIKERLLNYLGSLLDLIQLHVKNSNHIFHAQAFNDPICSFFVSIATLPNFQNCPGVIYDSFGTAVCYICQGKYYTTHDSYHFRSRQHITHFFQWLSRNFDFNVISAYCDKSYMEDILKKSLPLYRKIVNENKNFLIGEDSKSVMEWNTSLLCGLESCERLQPNVPWEVNEPKSISTPVHSTSVEVLSNINPPQPSSQSEILSSSSNRSQVADDPTSNPKKCPNSNTLNNSNVGKNSTEPSTKQQKKEKLLKKEQPSATAFKCQALTSEDIPPFRHGIATSSGSKNIAPFRRDASNPTSGNEVETAENRVDMSATSALWKILNVNLETDGQSSSKTGKNVPVPTPEINKITKFSSNPKSQTHMSGSPKKTSRHANSAAASGAKQEDEMASHDYNITDLVVRLDELEMPSISPSSKAARKQEKKKGKVSNTTELNLEIDGVNSNSLRSVNSSRDLDETKIISSSVNGNLLNEEKNIEDQDRESSVHTKEKRNRRRNRKDNKTACSDAPSGANLVDCREAAPVSLVVKCDISPLILREMRDRAKQSSTRSTESNKKNLLGTHKTIEKNLLVENSYTTALTAPKIVQNSIPIDSSSKKSSDLYKVYSNSIQVANGSSSQRASNEPRPLMSIPSPFLNSKFEMNRCAASDSPSPPHLLGKSEHVANVISSAIENTKKKKNKAASDTIKKQQSNPYPLGAVKGNSVTTPTLPCNGNVAAGCLRETELENNTLLGTSRSTRENSPRKNKNAEKPVKRRPRYKGVQVHPKNANAETVFTCEICNIQEGLSGLEEHLRTTQIHDELGQKNINTYFCLLCNTYVLFKKEPRHKNTKEHLSSHLARREKEALSQVEDLIKLTVLKVTGFQYSDQTYSNLYTFFKQFGKIDHMSITETQAIVHYFSKTSVYAAVDQSPLQIGDQQLLTLSAEIVSDGRYHLATKMVNYLSDVVALRNHCTDLVNDAIINMSNPIELQRQEMVLNILREFGKTMRPIAHPYLFGSRGCGLAVPSFKSTDLDVFLGSDDTYMNLHVNQLGFQKKLLKRLFSTLLHRKDVSDVTQLPKARVPIVTFCHKETNLMCDVSFRHGMSVENTFLIKFMLTLDVRVRPLILFLKEWIFYNGLYKIISNYALTMMIFHYLARVQPPVLPVIANLRTKNTKPLIIDGWDCSFSKLPWTRQNTMKFETLLLGFFRYYADFDYKNNIIFPLGATTISRIDLFQKSKSLPQVVRSQLRRIPIESFAKEIDVCIMDPFDFSHNLTKRVRHHAHAAHLLFLDLSAQLLQKELDFGL